MLAEKIICDKCRVALQEYRVERAPAKKIYQVSTAEAYEKFRAATEDCTCKALCERCSDAREEYEAAVRRPAEIFCASTDQAWDKLQETRGKCCGVSCLDLAVEGECGVGEEAGR